MDTRPYNPQYLENLYMWQMARDTISGESAIKAKKTRYLPMPAAMTINPEQTPSNPYDTDFGINGSAQLNLLLNSYNPNYHKNRAYQAYITRSQFPELPSFILRGLLGLTSNEKPTVSLPKSMEYLLDSATTTGLSLNDYYMYILSEVLSVGRIGSVLEINTEGKLVMASYSTESIVQWKTARINNSAKKKPSMVVLSEYKDNDPFSVSTEITTIYKILVLDPEAEGYYIKEVSESEIQRDVSVLEMNGMVSVPEFKGQIFNEIPIQMFGPVHNSFEIQNSPLATVSSTALQIYMKYADLSNSEFMSCSPTLVISGVSEDFAPKAVGSTVALILPEPDSKAYYTQTDTSALTHVLRHITDLYEQAVYAGAQLLDSSKKASESAETTRLKQAASGATLSSVVRNTSGGIESQLKKIAVIMGEDPNEVTFNAVTDFSAPALTAQEQDALVRTWVSGAISHATLLENFRRAGVLHDGETPDDEVIRIKKDKIKPAGAQESSSNDSIDEDDKETSNDDEENNTLPNNKDK